MKYTIISGNEDEVIAQVEQLLSEGWELYGNLICTNMIHSSVRGDLFSHNLFVQAMIKKYDNVTEQFDGGDNGNN